MEGRDHRHEGNAAAYLLGALPDLETQAFERHVMGCSTCRDEIELLRPAVEALPRSVAPLEPPARLKRTLMREVRDDLAPARPKLLTKVRRRYEGRSLNVRPALAWVSAAVLVVSGTALGFGAAQITGTAEPEILTASVDRDRATLGSASLTVPGDSERGALLSVHGMPTLPSGRSSEVYQLWLERAGEVIPGATFSVGSDGSGYGTIDRSLEAVDRVMVTREAPGGAKVPSETPIIEVAL